MTDKIASFTLSFRNTKTIVLFSIFLISVILHFLFFLSLFLNHEVTSKSEEKPAFVIKSYPYQSNPLTEKKITQEKNKKLKKAKTIVNQHTDLIKPSSNSAINMNRNLNHPLRLIGDKEIQKSLLKSIGESLAKTLAYPPLAADFRVKGKVIIGFLIHSDGKVNEVNLVQSSGSGILDEAAITAVSEMPVVIHANQFLQSPRYLVIGIIFG